MTWTGQTFSVGQILTAAQQNNLQADITAVMNQDSGSPTPATNFISLQSQLGANVVGQSELKDALQQTTGTGTVNILFTGGVYTLGWGIAGSGIGVNAHTAAAYTAGIRASGAFTYYFQARYFQASPPYNLGYGDIPLFIFAIVDNATGEVIAIDTAPDAPWHYNGPTDVRAKIYKEDKSFRYCKPIELELYNRDLNSLSAKERMGIARRVREEDATELLEITQDIKNADMNTIPNPFMGTNLTGKTVVLLDPCCELCEELFIFRGLGEDINNRFMNGHFAIDNTVLDVKSPAGVITVPFKWKLTK